jgi:hypothetical protein
MLKSKNVKYLPSVALMCHASKRMITTLVQLV